MHQAEEQGAEAIIITDKDAVKIPETLLCKKTTYTNLHH
mgnify:FL=1